MAAKLAVGHGLLMPLVQEAFATAVLLFLQHLSSHQLLSERKTRFQFQSLITVYHERRHLDSIRDFLSPLAGNSLLFFVCVCFRKPTEFLSIFAFVYIRATCSFPFLFFINVSTFYTGAVAGIPDKRINPRMRYASPFLKHFLASHLLLFPHRAV